jgi:hypothetical protein
MTATGVLDPIRDKMIEHLLSVTILGNVYKDFPPAEGPRPCAAILFGAARYRADINNTLDREIDVYISIYGTEQDQVDKILEDISKLWYGASNWAALKTLGVINLAIVDDNPPAVFTRSIDPVFADIRLLLTVRYNYT